MKKFLFTLVLAFAFCNMYAEVPLKVKPVSDLSDAPEVQALTPELVQLALDDFLTMTPAKYKEMTGKRLGFKNTIKLKIAQKKLKREFARDGGDGITKGLYILLAILGLAWVAMGVKSNWEGSDWIVNLILTVLCWLPGFIHALIKMKDYYPN